MKGSLVAVTIVAALAVVPVQNFLAQSNQTVAQSAIPDAPAPQKAPSLSEGVTPGSGTSAIPTAASQTTVTKSLNDDTGLAPTEPAPTVAPHTSQPDDQKEAPSSHYVLPPSNVTFVQVPVTVKDHSKNLVPGLDWRDFRIFENGTREEIRYFSVDPVPMSVALVIDQSVASQTMAKVNQALGSIPGAFANYDEIAVYTYNAYPKTQTTFTGSQSPRLTAVIERAKTEGRDTMIGPGSGPMGQGVYINDTSWQTMPTVSGGGPTAGGKLNVAPKEPHPLNDAILRAATDLAQRDPMRRRIIYVISDGREYGSKAKYKEVVHYLQEHRISVYGTLVGDSATWGLGFLDRLHMPLVVADNILPQYATATGGQFVGEFTINGIEKSFAAIAEEVRTQYRIGYYSTESIYDGKFRNVEVQVTRPGFLVIAPPGYFPSAPDHR